jgi:hypothetical protein
MPNSKIAPEKSLYAFGSTLFIFTAICFTGALLLIMVAMYGISIQFNEKTEI